MSISAAVPESWRTILDPVMATLEAHTLWRFIAAEEQAGKRIYPPRPERLAALALTPFDAVKVVILGQDPYHGPEQAHGLSFSVCQGTPVPPSLRNIFTEIAADLAIPRPNHGDLSGWAKQGVLLLNTVLTVEEAKPGSHAGRGWEAITDAVVGALAAKPEPCVFLLWGAHAHKKAASIAGPNTHSPHLILSAPHPSPLSAYRGWFGCRHFSQTNAFLAAMGREAIDWGLSPRGV